MRVIAGEYRGRRLCAPNTLETRPVTDRVKESLFSSLGDRVVAARVIDLFAGTGSLGIEAASRGARSVTFVESGREALRVLRENLGQLGIQAQIVAGTVEKFVESVEEEFDLVFCDPPWRLGSQDIESILHRLSPRLPEGTLAVVTRRASDSVPHPKGFRIDDERRHGDTRIIRYEKEEE